MCLSILSVKRSESGDVLKYLILKIKDPVSCLTHMAGALLSLIGLVLLLVMAVRTKTPWHIVGFAIFGTSMVLLYTASTLYHMLNISDRGNRILRKIDHMMIFVLIAGTYTPICLTLLRGIWGWSILAVVWTIALFGIVLKGFFINTPRWLSTLIYLVMGWIVIVAIYPLVRAMSIGGLVLLSIGGAMYTLGAAIYGFKWPKINFRYFGFHELFHLFVMAGSLSHFLMMYFAV